MKDISRIGYNIGTLLSIEDILRFAKKIEEKKKYRLFMGTRILG